MGAPLSKLESLKPLLPKEKKESVGTFDIESNSWTKFEMAGTYDGYTFNKHDTVKDMLDCVFDSPFESKRWYAHNGGRFDFLFILNSLRQYTQKPISLLCMGPSISGITVKRPRRRHVHFRDSFSLLPHSLEKLGEHFQCASQKQVGAIDFETERVDRNNAKHVAYLEADCRTLHEVLEKFATMPLVRDAGLKVSLASTALAAWRTTLDQEIFSTPTHVQESIRESYAGGRCEIFKTVSRDGHCYDVNSLYPAMLLKPLPMHYLGKTRDIGDFGFHKVAVYVPKSSVPILWQKEPKLFFPTGKIMGTFFSEELKLAIEQGASVLKYLDGWKFLPSDQYFKKFVHTCYQLREQHREGPINLTAKLLMNSVYGKTGEREAKKSLFIVDPKKPWTWPKPPFERWRSPQFFERYGFLTKEISRRMPHMQVHIASATTAWGRVYMAKNFYIPHYGKIAYTDTDSVFIEKELTEIPGLGGLKKEYSYRNAFFVVPKGYYIETTDNKLIRKLKGFSKKYINSLSLEDFLKKDFKYSEKSRILTFREALIRKNNILATGDRVKSLKATYDKREVLKSGLTRPWHNE